MSNARLATLTAVMLVGSFIRPPELIALGLLFYTSLERIADHIIRSITWQREKEL